MTGMLVEVAPGQVKRWGVCSPKERRQADELARRKGKMLMRHSALLGELGPLLEAGASADGPPAADMPVFFAVHETGRLPDLILTPLLARELQALEGWIDELRAA